MVAPGGRHIHSTRTAELPQSLLLGRGSLVRFTVSNVLSMIRQGQLREDATTELLDGLIVHKDRSDLGDDPLVHGPKHRVCVRLLTALAARVKTQARHGQVQLPVVCGDDEMLEPDFALVRGGDRDYADSLPTAADVLLVIEAADSSLERDRNEKLPIYAAAGIPQYVIINLCSMTIAVYTQPDAQSSAYRSTITVAREESFVLRGGPDGDIQVQASDLLS